MDIEMPSRSTKEDRALILAACIFLEYRFFNPEIKFY